MSALSYDTAEPDASNAPPQAATMPPVQTGVPTIQPASAVPLQAPTPPGIVPAAAQAQLAPATAVLQQQQLARTAQLGARLEQILGLVPEVLRSAAVIRRVGEHPAAEEIRTVNQAARRRPNEVDFAALTKTLDGVDATLDTLEQYLAGHREDLEGIARIYATFTGDELDALAKARDDLGAKLLRQQASPTEVKTFARKLQAEAVPTNKEMQGLRKANAQEAMDKVAQLVQAELAAIDTGHRTDFYESEYDLAEDHFGASWQVQPAAATGTAQWLREWEFHVHAVATRAAGALTGFTINRGHIKPSSDAHALGASIQITNAGVLAKVENDTRARFLRWAATPAGAGILKGKKRT